MFQFKPMSMQPVKYFSDVTDAEQVTHQISMAELNPWAPCLSVMQNARHNYTKWLQFAKCFGTFRLLQTWPKRKKQTINNLKRNSQHNM
jgi:DNA-binding transcriptional regulator YbjK